MAADAGALLRALLALFEPRFLAAEARLFGAAP